MQRFIAKRALQSLLAIWVMSLIVFTLVRVTGNPLDVMLPLEAGPEDYARVSKHWGLDQPVYVQYAIFLGKAVQGDFGNSWKWHGHSAMGLVWQRLPATLQLAGFALLVSVVIALPVGVLSAVMKGTVWDTVAKVIALLGHTSGRCPARTRAATPPALWDLPEGCRFAPRCPHAFARCSSERPRLLEVDGELVRCFLHEQTQVPVPQAKEGVA